jgi:glutamate synthase domain-containing protein 1
MMKVTMSNRQQGGGGRPAAQGLYDPAFEHDACGVGMVCNLKGVRSHDVVHKALQILINLSHRGACGCDETTGDGAGILMQIPDRFLRKVAGGLGFTLPPETEYAAGLVFLPREAAERQFCMDLFERVIRAEGQVFLGWRNVPQHNEVLGDIARGVEPDIHQIFIGRGTGLKDQAHFERKLFVIRKVMENAVRASALKEKAFFYVPSLSSRTLVYKGLMLADQIEPFLPDLADPDLQSGMALVHQRYSTNTFPTWDLAQPFRFLCHNGEINTLRGNVNWLTARQALFQSDLFGDDMRKLFPIATPGASDSAILDNAIELLYHAGRSLPHAVIHADPGGLAEPPDHERREAGFLPVPRLPVRAVGRPRLHPVLRRQLRGRRARPQRPAPLPLHSDQGRLRHHGLRDGRAGGRPRQRGAQGPPAARPHVPGRHVQGPHRGRRGDQAARWPPAGPTARG